MCDCFAHDVIIVLVLTLTDLHAMFGDEGSGQKSFVTFRCKGKATPCSTQFRRATGLDFDHVPGVFLFAVCGDASVVHPDTKQTLLVADHKNKLATSCRKGSQML